jgi:hypothetical protein
MLALGCLFPVAFFIGGAILGALIAGESGAMWGAATGLGMGIAVPAVLALLFARARRKRR